MAGRRKDAGQRRRRPVAIGEVVARRLREVRNDRKWTQQDLADELARLGAPMDRTTIAKVEKGQRQARADELVAFAAALDTAVVDLLLPPEDDEPVALTPKLKVDSGRAHEWAEGRAPLDERNARHYARQRPFVRRLEPDERRGDEMWPQLAEMFGLSDDQFTNAPRMLREQFEKAVAERAAGRSMSGEEED